MAAVKVDSELNFLDSWSHYIKPHKQFTISERSEGIHGLSKEFIINNGKTLKEVGGSFLEFIDNCDFLTYNGNTFDIRFLYKDFGENGMQIPMIDSKFYDAYAMERRLNSRKLADVYNKYTGEELKNAHDALSDVYATIGVFKGQLNHYNMMSF